jgi:hypothetical protein
VPHVDGRTRLRYWEYKAWFRVSALGEFCISLRMDCFVMQVFYYLGELNDSLIYALGAGPLFDVTEDSEYVQTLVGELNLTQASKDML